MPELTYLTGSVVAMVIWLILYWHRKDLRKKMLIVSSILAVLSLILEAFIWTRDWWQPRTVTGTVIGIEDVFFGFGIAGILAVAYEELFRKNVRMSLDVKPDTETLMVVLASGIVASNLLYFVFRVHSFYASVVAMLIPVLLIWQLRKDLIPVSLMSGILGAIIAYLIAGVMYLIQPGYVQEWWMLSRLSGIRPFGLPIEDALWFFVAGMLVGPLYEFWTGARLIDAGTQTL